MAVMTTVTVSTTTPPIPTPTHTNVKSGNVKRLTLPCGLNFIKQCRKSRAFGKISWIDDERVFQVHALTGSVVLLMGRRFSGS